MRVWQIILLMASSQIGFADQWSDIKESVEDAPRRWVGKAPAVRIPGQTTQLHGAFELIRRPGEQSVEALERILRENDLSDDVSLSVTKQESFNLGLTGRTRKSSDIRFEIDGIPLCDFQVKIHQTDKSTVTMGRMPIVRESAYFDLSLDDAHATAEHALADQGYDLANAKLTDAEQCYYLEAGRPIAMYQMVIETDDLPYEVLANAEYAVRAVPRYFDLATGTARVYAENPTTSLKTFTLDGLTDGTNELENSYFTTSTSGTKASESDRNYTYDTTDGRFDETSAFVHTNLQLQFFQGLGYDWGTEDKLNIIVHAVIQGSTNNALYTPASGSSAAKIQIGDGDGSKLANLPKDGDVSAHELGHHVIYNNITSTEGESLVLHEGLADYFAMARTNDDCLGESICPEGSPIGCEKEAQCLRSADNSYILNVNTRKEAHYKSQFVSGMLYKDLRDDEVPAASLDSIVFGSVQRMLSKSGYHDFVLGMMLSDLELNDGQYCEAIRQAAVDRGLESHISDLVCGGDLPGLTGSEDTAGETETVTVKNDDGESGSDFPLCGVTGPGPSKPNDSAAFLALLLILGLPILIPLLRVKEERIWVKINGRRRIDR